MTEPTGSPHGNSEASTDGDRFAPPGVQPTSLPAAPAPVFPTPAHPAPATAGPAIIALVCAILSWIAVPVVLAIVALVLARSAEREIQTSRGQKTGDGLVTAARWIAWIHLLVVAMVIAFGAAFLVAVAVAR